MSFNAKIEKYVGSITNLDTDTAVQQSTDYTLGLIKGNAPHLLPLFTRRIEATNGNAFNLVDNHVFDLVKVERLDGSTTYFVTPIPSNALHKISDSSSIYHAQAYSPAYSVSPNGELSIHPAPDSTDKAFLYVVIGSAGKTFDVATNTTIKDSAATYYGASDDIEENFPENWKTFVILQASENLLREKIADLTLGTSTATNAEAWLADEDESMVQSTLQLVNQLNTQIGIVSQAKKEFLQSQGVGGISDNPKEGQI